MSFESTAKRADGLVALVLLAWFLIAFVLGLSGRLTALRPPAPELGILILTAGSLGAVFLVPRLSAWADQVSIRSLVAMHLVRFVGIYFLWLARRGGLAPGFAIPAGWGDIATAAFAFVLIIAISPATNSGRSLYQAWNLLGFVDILFVSPTRHASVWPIHCRCNRYFVCH